MQLAWRHLLKEVAMEITSESAALYTVAVHAYLDNVITQHLCVYPIAPYSPDLPQLPK